MQQTSSRIRLVPTENLMASLCYAMTDKKKKEDI